MDRAAIIPGQRWVSDSEPEMGLGMILRVEHATLEVLFPAAEETRCYALESAPLRRVIYKVGEVIVTHDGKELEVSSLSEADGIVTYQTEEGDIPEAQLSDTMGFNMPHDRLYGGQVDEDHVYRLRAEALYRQNDIRKSPLRGYLGGRTDLLPHQLSIVSEVAKRLSPRVLLADEVGLGKTIEACMIMHRLHLTGRANRVLILLPEPLINQWFVELLRRFNMLFSIFYEGRCASIEENDPEANPFLDSQLVIASVDFLASNERRAEQAKEAGWDLLIVDEAHHLSWSQDEVSAEYEMVEGLASTVESVLLLTATPQQLGQEGHFARLRLLDPERFNDLDSFIAESEKYEEVATVVEQIENGDSVDLSQFSDHSSQVKELAEKLDSGDESARASLVESLLDGFGTGRVMFRNTRSSLTGFPERQAHLVELDGDEFEEKISWLVGLLNELGDEKVLLICETKEMVEEISEALLTEVQVNVAHFHEELSLLQRDRNAAYFAEEEGARVLLCSEIGSEGRNFQFAHHLVLFDLPKDPELLEQRIGRLDRIGQTSTIHIHVPYALESSGELWARWYHEGLGALEQNVHGATEIFQVFEDELLDLEESFDEDDVERLIEATVEQRETVGQRLAGGYDRLLELNSYHPAEAKAVIKKLQAADADPHFEEFLVRMLDYFGLDVEDLSDRTYFIKPGNLITDAFPNIPDEGVSVTFDRAKALAREEMTFMTWDHPIARACFDLFLGSESGNATFGVWEKNGEKGILMEEYFVIEVIAPSDLHIDRFLPATPIRVVVDHNGADLSNEKALLNAKLRKGGLRKLLAKPVVKQHLVPKMLDQLESLAKAQMPAVIDGARKEMKKQLRAEIRRIKALAAVNPMIGEEEIEALENHMKVLDEAIQSARLRPDALRMVWIEPTR
ncbi:ATP-dependent helicase HepA [Rubritalea squalenifaciens DSM 18772]|uniref:ATP-dependent helicase HepA n=1 Tax=Rubritalea squalenifaciens DSM 18772 TaxID=1123071 RepID=A0A1M6HSC5_9BACT|nr:helicase-related protein [Rubritalea squalenifaciens]SHJ25078.1 ATP-dependent helicase HepA [Rubritalea squalenifaciens DSM 18772]